MKYSTIAKLLTNFNHNEEKLDLYSHCYAFCQL